MSNPRLFLSLTRLFVMAATLLGGVHLATAAGRSRSDRPTGRPLAPATPGFSRFATGLETPVAPKSQAGPTAKTVSKSEALRPRPAMIPSPSAGVYKTWPFSCLVIVPSGSIDSGIQHSPAQPVPPTPTIKPPLYFIPYQPAK